jgi:hypothetical protein
MAGAAILDFVKMSYWRIFLNNTSPRCFFLVKYGDNRLNGSKVYSKDGGRHEMATSARVEACRSRMHGEVLTGLRRTSCKEDQRSKNDCFLRIYSLLSIMLFTFILNLLYL